MRAAVDDDHRAEVVAIHRRLDGGDRERHRAARVGREHAREQVDGPLLRDRPAGLALRDEGLPAADLERGVAARPVEQPGRLPHPGLRARAADGHVEGDDGSGLGREGLLHGGADLRRSAERAGRDERHTVADADAPRLVERRRDRLLRVGRREAADVEAADRHALRHEERRRGRLGASRQRDGRAQRAGRQQEDNKTPLPHGLILGKAGRRGGQLRLLQQPSAVRRPLDDHAVGHPLDRRAVVRPRVGARAHGPHVRGQQAGEHANATGSVVRPRRRLRLAQRRCERRPRAG